MCLFFPPFSSSTPTQHLLACHVRSGNVFVVVSLLSIIIISFPPSVCAKILIDESRSLLEKSPTHNVRQCWSFVRFFFRVLCSSRLSSPSPLSSSVVRQWLKVSARRAFMGTRIDFSFGPRDTARRLCMCVRSFCLLLVINVDTNNGISIKHYTSPLVVRRFFALLLATSAENGQMRRKRRQREKKNW